MSWWAGLLRGKLPTWYHPDYRLPIGSVEGHLGIEPRRADLACWWLVDAHSAGVRALIESACTSSVLILSPSVA